VHARPRVVAFASLVSRGQIIAGVDVVPRGGTDRVFVIAAICDEARNVRVPRIWLDDLFDPCSAFDAAQQRVATRTALARPAG